MRLGGGLTLDVQKGDIESTTTQIEDQDVALLVRLSGTKSVSNSSGSGLIDDTKDIQSSDGAGILGGLTLVVVEVGRNSDDGLLNGLSQLCFGNLLHLFGGGATSAHYSRTRPL